MLISSERILRLDCVAHVWLAAHPMAALLGPAGCFQRWVPPPQEAACSESRPRHLKETQKLVQQGQTWGGVCVCGGVFAGFQGVFGYYVFTAMLCNNNSP